MRIGLIGPIGCGKSTVAGWLAERGGSVIDADRLAREATAPGEPTLLAIRARFGDAVFARDGVLDRAALGRIVFAAPAALRDLEAIVHPAVRRRLDAAVAAAESSGAPFVVVEAIKLVEAGYAAGCDEVWLVTCGPATQRARLAAKGVSADDAERRIAAQGADLADRLRRRAARVIVTDESPEETRAAVEATLELALRRGAAR